MYNAHWIHSLPYSKFIELTLIYHKKAKKSKTTTLPYLRFFLVLRKQFLEWNKWSYL